MGLFGTILSVFGLDCTTIASDNPKLKARMVSGTRHSCFNFFTYQWGKGQICLLTYLL